MWEIALKDQIVSCLYSLLVGLFFGLVYDILKTIFLKFKFGNIVVFIKDITFSAFAAVVTFLLLMARCNGMIRGYILVFIVLGFVVYRLSVSKYLLKIFGFILDLVLKINAKVVKFFNFFYNKTDEFELAIIKIFKKITKKQKKKEKRLET